MELGLVYPWRKMYRGSKGIAGEMSHIQLINGRLCGCGLRAVWLLLYLHGL